MATTPFYTAPDPKAQSLAAPGGPDAQAYGSPTAPDSSAFNQTPPATPADMGKPADPNVFLAPQGDSAQPKDMSKPADPTAFKPTAEVPTAAPHAPADLGGFETVKPYESTLSDAALTGGDQLKTDRDDGLTFLPKTPDNMPTATHWNVTAEQTVAGQFASVMDSDNPAFQVVQEQVRRAAAASGQQNSAMAARGMAMAMAEVGFKMATQDAATFARSAEFNAAMDNQFGLANLQFMHTAMLSEQNFRQGVVMQRESNAAQLEQINAQLSSQMQLFGAQASFNLQLEQQRLQNTLAQMDFAHTQQLEAMRADLAAREQLMGSQANIDAQARTETQQNTLAQMDRQQSHALQSMQADLAAREQLMGSQANIDARARAENQQNTLSQMDRAHAQGLENLHLQSEYNWASAEQAQGHALGRMDRETANALYQNEAQFGWQMQLNYGSEVGQNSRMLLGAIGEIGANPNITAAQASAAVASLLRQYNAVNDQIDAAYANAVTPGNMAGGYLNFTGRPAQPQAPAPAGPTPPFYGGTPSAPAPAQPAPTAPTSPLPTSPPVIRPPIDPPVTPYHPNSPVPGPSPVAVPPFMPPAEGGTGGAGGGKFDVGLDRNRLAQ